MNTVDHQRGRRRVIKLAGASAVGTVLLPMQRAIGQARHAGRQLTATQAGAVADGKTLNTEKLQAAINHLAAQNGGTLVIPAGTFLTGSLFFKPGVHLHLEQGGVLKGSTDIRDYPIRQTRIEGHFQKWVSALINADECDHLRIEGPGTLDGNGAPFWKEFWTRLAANRKTTNLDVPRPRLAFIENSHDVQISGLTFKDSGFWNLHLYRCQEVVVENTRFEVPDGVRCPSTDGTDIDSCQHVTIRGCTYRVDDDCVCLKGNKGPFALDENVSPPVEHILIENNTYERGGGVATLGSEATVVRDVLVQNCKVLGAIPVVHLKLRPDTPQTYEDLQYRNITLDENQDEMRGPIIQVLPWMQYFDLQGQPRPKSTVRNVTVDGIKGRFGEFGVIRANPGQTTLGGFRLENINVQLKNPKFTVGSGIGVTMKDVIVNGKPLVISRV